MHSTNIVCFTRKEKQTREQYIGRAAFRESRLSDNVEREGKETIKNGKIKQWSADTAANALFSGHGCTEIKTMQAFADSEGL